MKGSLALRNPLATGSYDLSGGAIGTSDWVTIIASLGKTVDAIEIYNPTPATLLIATGAAAAEVAIPYRVPPGGSVSIIAANIAKSSRISMKAVDQSTGAVGLITINGFG